MRRIPQILIDYLFNESKLGSGMTLNTIILHIKTITSVKPLLRFYTREGESGKKPIRV